MSKFGKDINVPNKKGVFIPDITVEMLRNASLENVENLLVSGEMEDISLPSAQFATDINVGCTIYRQDVIDVLDVLCQEHRYKIPGDRETYSTYNEGWQDALDRVESAIGNLPSAQPQRKKGEWEEIEVIPERKTGRWIPHESVFGGSKEMVYTCDQCGHNIGFHMENYCPSCGANMRGERDE